MMRNTSPEDDRESRLFSRIHDALLGASPDGDRKAIYAFIAEQKSPPVSPRGPIESKRHQWALSEAKIRLYVIDNQCLIPAELIDVATQCYARYIETIETAVERIMLHSPRLTEAEQQDQCGRAIREAYDTLSRDMAHVLGAQLSQSLFDAHRQLPAIYTQ
jgi:hypothetical protein